MKSTIQRTIVLILFAVGMVSFFAIPIDGSPTWCRDFVVSKLIAAAAFHILVRCIRRRDPR